MKKIFIGIFIGGLFCVLTILTAGVKEKKGDDFLRINDNIQNEELRTELEELREEFNIETKRIRGYYNEKMQTLKDARRKEMKIIKKDFAERREIMMKKYIGKMRKKKQIRSTEPVKNSPDKKKAHPKDKKRIRKP